MGISMIQSNTSVWVPQIFDKWATTKQGRLAISSYSDTLIWTCILSPIAATEEQWGTFTERWTLPPYAACYLIFDRRDDMGEGTVRHKHWETGCKFQSLPCFEEHTNIHWLCRAWELKWRTAQMSTIRLFLAFRFFFFCKLKVKK